MPTEADGQYCVYRDETGEKRFPITGVEDAATCRRWQGHITDGGSPHPQRISSLTLRDQLSGANWTEPVAKSPLQMRDFGAILLSFPLCEAHRRFPDAPLVAALDRLDSQFTAEIREMITRDPQLGHRIEQLVLRGASSTAAALAWSGEDADQPAAEDLFEFAQKLAQDVAAVVGNDLGTAIRAAQHAAEPLRGVALSDAVSVVARSVQPDSAH